MLERIELNEQEFNSLDEYTRYFVTTFNKIYDEILSEVKPNEGNSKKSKR